MKYVLRSLAAVGCALACLAAPIESEAAEFTDVLDAADDKDDYLESTYDPFDFNLEASFEYRTGTADITRERPCVNASSRSDFDSPFQDDRVKDNPRVIYDREDCQRAGAADDNEFATLESKELRFRHRETRLDVSGRIGLYKDLELHFDAPFVLQRSRALKYANNIGPGRSDVDPGQGRIDSDAQSTFGNTSSKQQAAGRLRRYRTHRFFDVTDEYSGARFTRAGFDDPTVGLSWGAFNDKRDDTKASMVLAMDYTLPVAEPKSADNPDAVGDGLHKLEWSFLSSKQYDWVEPYFGARYMLQLPAQGTPIKDLATIDSDNEGQSVTNAPHVGRFTVGTEFVPYEKKTQDGEHRRYAIDLTFTFGYNSEGLTYSPLYDHFVNSSCNGRSFGEVLPEYDNNGYAGSGNVECSWIAQRPANVRSGSPTYNPSQIDEDTTLRTNGIMTVGPYASFTGNVGIYMQPTKYFQLKLNGGITHRREHYISNARTGNDVDDGRETTNDDKVDLSGEDAKIERNPAYNPAYDANGTRFRIGRNNTFSLLVTAAVQF